jgi:hypothetical protein
MPSPTGYLVAALGILTFAFVLSIPIATVFGDSFHIVVALEADPSSYVVFVMEVLFYYLLPIFIALLLCVFSYVKATTEPRRKLGSLGLLSFGGLLLLWGVLYFPGAYNTYLKASDMVDRWNVGYVNGSLQIIYTAYGAIGIMWMLAGIFLIAIYRKGKVNYEMMKMKEIASMIRQESTTN